MSQGLRTVEAMLTQFRRCALCEQPGPVLCDLCADALPPAPQLEPISGLDDLVVLMAYEQAGRRLVQQWKYRGDDRLLVPMAAAIAAQLGGSLLPPASVTWTPCAPRNRRTRGRDQARSLGEAIARCTGLPVHALLARAPGPTQTGRRRSERENGPVFVGLGRVPPTVLLVDDVVTTGSTLASAAEVLRQQGARTVLAAAIARTPLPRAGETH